MSEQHPDGWEERPSESVVAPEPEPEVPPAIEPAPEQDNRIVKVLAFPCSTSRAKTGRKTSSGIAKVVMQKARTIRASIAVCLRINPIPCFMLVSIDSPVLAGTKRVRMTSSEMMTATKETPLRPKHHVAPQFASAMPPRTGPITRAKLN